MSNGPSEWKSGTLGDITGVQEVLTDINNFVTPIQDGISTITSLLESVVALVEVASDVVSSTENIQKIAMELAIQQIEALKDALIQVLRQTFDMGAYLLPHFETFDFPKHIRNELLNPGFAQTTTTEPKDQVVRVVKEGQSYLKLVRRAGMLEPTDYKAFINSIIKSLDDTNDPLRPQFGPNTKVDSVIMAISAPRIAILIALYIVLDSIFGDPRKKYGKLESFVKIINTAIGQAEMLGRTSNSDSIRELNMLKDAIEITLSRSSSEGAFEVIMRFLKLFKLNDVIDISPKGPLGVTYYSIDKNVAHTLTTSQSAQGILTPTTIIKADTALFNNVVLLKMKTSGDGVLVGHYEYPFGRHDFVVGVGQKEWEVAIPINTVGEARLDESGRSLDMNGLPLNLDYSNGLSSNGKNYGIPTTATFEFIQVNDQAKIDDYLTHDTNIPNTPNTHVSAKSAQLKYVLPRFRRIALNSRGQRVTWDDGFQGNAQFAIKPSDSSTLTNIADYLGISVSEAQNKFPVLVRGNKVDLTRFGESLRKVTITVNIYPTLDVLGNFFVGKLIVNGKVYTPNTSVIGLRNAELVFNNVDLGESKQASVIFVAEQKQQTYNQELGIYENFVAYSEPFPLLIQRSGGLLSAPTITSGDKVNAATNVFEIGSDATRDQTVFTTSSSPIANSLGVQRFKQVGTNLQNIYGSGVGSNAPSTNVRNAVYRLTGKKTEDCLVYAVVTSTADPKKSRMHVISLASSGVKTPNLELTGPIDLGKNFYSGNLLLELPSDKDFAQYSIRVYQANDPKVIEAVLTATRSPSANQEQEFLKLSKHQSNPASKMVTVTALPSGFGSHPPDWLTISLGAFFPIVDPIDRYLTELIDTLKAGLPSGPYDAIKDWLDLIKEKIQLWIDVFNKIKAILDNINSILQVGGAGFWFLGIAGANGVNGFKERLQKVPVPEELAKAKYVTGLVMITPGEFEDPITGIKLRSKLMDTVFAKLPSSGQDTVKVPDDKTLKEVWLENEQVANERFNQERLKRLKSKEKALNIVAEQYIELSRKSEDI